MEIEKYYQTVVLSGTSSEVINVSLLLGFCFFQHYLSSHPKTAGDFPRVCGQFWVIKVQFHSHSKACIKCWTELAPKRGFKTGQKQREENL
jgi:hypothetical protein